MCISDIWEEGGEAAREELAARFGADRVAFLRWRHLAVTRLLTTLSVR